jgi:hypothetical protein
MWKFTAPLENTGSTTLPSATTSITPFTVFELEPDADPPKVLAIGPDLAGNLLEII